MLRAPGAPVIKSPADIRAMRGSGAAAARVLHAAVDACRPGVTTRSIDLAARSAIKAEGAQALLCGQVQDGSPPFPGAVCISINDEVLHGVPGDREIQRGDIVSIDVGIRLGGWCADVATTIQVEPLSAPSPRPRCAAGLIAGARDVLAIAISMIRPGIRWSSIATAMEARAGRLGFGIITGYIGHGIGRDLHEPPRVPAYWGGYGGPEFTLAEGMVLTIEPIVCEVHAGPVRAKGRLPERVPVRLLADGWTVVTATGLPAAHAEHTVAVVAGGADVLTRAADETGHWPLPVPADITPARYPPVTEPYAQIG